MPLGRSTVSVRSRSEGDSDWADAVVHNAPASSVADNAEIMERRIETSSCEMESSSHKSIRPLETGQMSDFVSNHAERIAVGNGRADCRKLSVERWRCMHDKRPSFIHVIFQFAVFDCQQIGESVG